MITSDQKKIFLRAQTTSVLFFLGGVETNQVFAISKQTVLSVLQFALAQLKYF